MSLYDKEKEVELRVLGPEGKAFIELENEFTESFRNEGYYFSIPRLFSAPAETAVYITIGIGVISGVSTYLLTSLIDKVFKIKKEKSQNNTNITFKIHIGDKYIDLPNDREEILKKLESLKKDAE